MIEPRPGPDRRVFAVLALAQLVSALASGPYGRFLGAQSPRGLIVPNAGLDALAELGLALVVFCPLLWLGLALARGLGLGAPLLEARFRGAPAAGRAPRVLLRAGALGALFGAAGLAILQVANGHLSAELTGARPPLVAPPAWMGALASFGAGIREETVLRLFFLSALARPLAQVIARTPALAVATTVSALVFGLLHFGNVWMLGLHLTACSAAVILGLNAGLGLLCGWLFCTRGIEAAIVAHVACDLVLHGLAPALGVSGRA